MRVSRKGDRDPDEWLTVPKQRNTIEGWIVPRGHTLVDLREDIDVSGRIDDRPNLEALAAQIENGDLDGLVVAKVDRFSRDLAYGAMVVRRIERAGGTFVAADDGVMIGPGGREFGGSNDTAHFLFAQLLSMADLQGRRITRGWHDVLDRHVMQRGRHWGYAPPFGYRLGEDRRLVPDPAQAPLLVEVFERRAAGAGASSIAAWLDGLGVRTARNGRPTHRWVMDLLRNRVYLGEARGGKSPDGKARVYVDAHPALVDEGLFAAAAARVGIPRRRGRVGGVDAPALSGLVRCWSCRTVMTGALAPYRGGTRRIYRCRGRHAQGACPGPASAVEAELFELAEPVFWATLGADARARELADGSRDGERLEAAVVKATRALTVYRDSEEIAEMDGALFAEGLRVRQQRLSRARAELADWRRSLPREEVDAGELHEAWPSLSLPERGMLLADVIGAIVVQRPRVVRRGVGAPLRGRAAILRVLDMPGDLPAPGRRADDVRGFPPFDDEATPWVLLG